MPPIATTLIDNHDVAYAVKFKPPTEFNPVARVEVWGEKEYPVAELMFGERNPGYFYIDDLQVHCGTRRGIGSRLLAIAEAYASEHGFSEVHGTIIAYDPASADCAFLRAWYERHGYVGTFVAGHPRKEYCGDISKKIKPAYLKD